PETFCVGDVNAIVRTSGVPGNQIRVRLVSPLGVRRQIWSQGPLAVPLDVTFDDESLPGTMPPLNSLSIFDNQPGGGTWTFRVEDAVPGTQGTLNEWGLSFTACPVP
ncbi:MAG TPA: proprotein convertase P-domain-containing protein, partial [Vicinamibacteria bacterium]|nr:proprotein convertase P-domain-containing protein [Vicinamibacteria bacterium]